MPKIITDKTIAKIREDYAKGDLSLIAIAKKYKISFNTLQKYTKEPKWGERPFINNVIEPKKFFAYNAERINKVVENSINTLERVNNNIDKTQRGLKFLEDLKSKIEQNLLLAEQMTQELLEKPTVSKTVIIDTSTKGIKKITETRSLDGHEKASVAKIIFDKYKTLCLQNEPQAPAVVINNNNAQMQINETIQKDLEALSEKLIDTNIENLKDEN